MSAVGSVLTPASKRRQPRNLLRESNRVSTSSMPSSIKAEKRQRQNASDQSDDEDDEIVGGSSQKRIRTIASSEEDDKQVEIPPSAHTINGTQSNGRVQTSSHSQSNATRIQTIQSRSNAGSIVRVKLQRFVTYDFVEFRPGPNLNMIIGPNGTGKSTIVCAIALGLGWKPAVLGRAKDVASYVKNDREDATIELELKAKDDSQPNVVLERRIYKKANRSDWKLNGRPTTNTKVQEKVDEFNISIGNLCCFLPQDKVADFARMAPAELLKETQKAAGVEGMTQWHDKLIGYGRTQADMKAKLDKERDDVNNLEERNKILQKDVRRAEERQKIEDEIALLELRIPFARYSIAKQHYDDLKIIRNEKKKEFDDLQKKVAPLDERLKEMEKKNAGMIKEIKVKQRNIGEDTSIFKALHQSLDEQEKQGGKFADQLASVRKREIEGRRIQAQLIRKVSEMEEAILDEPPRPNTSEIDARVRTIKEELRNMKADEADHIAASDEIDAESKRLDRELDQNRAELVKIDSVKGNRLEMLRSSDVDAYKAVMWLRENQSMFKKPVNEPVVLELSVKKPQLASAVETCINWQTMKTFVCETRDDYNLFTRELNDKQKLRLNVAEIEDSAPLSSYRSPMDQRELESLGFNHFLLDCIEAPDTIKRFLCNNSHLHMIPLAINERGVDVEAVERSGRFLRYIVGNSNSTITYSQYGNKAPQIFTRNLRPARSLVHSIDQTRKRGLESKQQRIGLRKRELEENIKALNEKEVTRHKRIEVLRRQQLDLEQEKGAAQRERSMWEKQVVNLNSTKEALAHEQAKPSAEEQTRKLTADLAKVNGESQGVIKKMTILMQKQVQKRSEVDILSLQQLHYAGKVQALAALKMEQEEQFQEAQLARDQAVADFAVAKMEASKLFTHTQSVVDSVSGRLQAELTKAQEESDPTLEQLETRLMEEQGKLELMMEVRPGVMEEYNERRHKIEEINIIIQKLAKDKDKIDMKIEALEKKWVTALESLVTNVSERFSRAFQSIGNAGEVRIGRHEDYDKWGINIMVKFRDNEQLQLLTATRQSGGERSISTITYLLSLTEMSRSPFSLVDEINQGMDQKYERQVHNHMVSVTCREGAGQYFLITPKLLPHLTYHEKMKILVINNGEWLPEEGFNFKHYIRQRQQNSRLTPMQAAIAA